MKRLDSHHLFCDAAICPFDLDFKNNLNNWCWYPDEKICNKGPYTPIQKTQRKIRHLFENGFVQLDRYFKASDLLMIKRAGKGIKGRSGSNVLINKVVSHERGGGNSSEI